MSYNNANNFIVITDNREDNQEQSMMFSTPIRKGDKSVQVLVIKRFLGIEFTDGDYFDEKTKKELKAWQNENIQEIMANGNMLEGLNLEETEGVINGQIDSSVWRTEYGTVGAATIQAMIQGTRPGAGAENLREALKHTLQDLEGVRGDIVGSDTDPTEILGERTPSDAEEAPYSDNNYYYYTYKTFATRESIATGGDYVSLVSEQSEYALRKGVEKVFQYFNKKKTWSVGGTTDNSGVQDARIRLGRRMYYTDATTFNPILKFQRRVNQSGINPGEHFSLSIEPQSAQENRDLTGRNVDVLFGQDLKEGAKPIFAAIKKIHSPTQRPGSTFKFTIIINKRMFDLIPRNAASASRVDPSEGTYQGSEEIFRKSEEAVKDAGRWITDSTGVSELVSGRAADKAAKKAKRALEREGKKVLNTMKEDMLRPPGTPRPNRGGFDALRNASTMSEADSEAARRIKGGDFPDSREYPIGFGLFKQIINDVADGMIDYGKDLEKWKAKGGSFKPPINP